ncbi:MAG: hypothetical protein H8E62_03780 [Planctomycetes bacterium]|nr:hypothetical protein [Planctomycetota bacterium]
MATKHSNPQTLDLISIFHYVVAAIIYLKGAVAFVFMGIGSIAMMGILADQPADMEALVVIGLLFFMVPMMFLTVSWTAATLVLFAGRRIANRTNLTYCQIVAGIECLCVPFGTILGIFSLITLTKPENKEIFKT